MSYAFWADVIVVFHAAYVGFVVFGQLAILLALACGWRWGRNFYFRATHLLMIAVVAAEAVAGIECPLTVWERHLRELAHQSIESASFMGYLCNKVLFYPVDPAIFPPLHIGFGVLVLATFLLAPPRLPEWLRFGKPATPHQVPA